MGYGPQIFFESLWTASIVPFSSEPTYFALKAFGGHDMALPFAAAVIGATLGQMFNWGVGRVLLELKTRGKIKVDEVWYGRSVTQFNRYRLYLLLLVCWLPLGNILTVIAGFLGLRLRVALPVVLIGVMAHYGWNLL